MTREEQFDFVAFSSTLRGLPREKQRLTVRVETGRAREVTVREPSVKFKQQIYVRRLERLGRFLGGEDVSMELTPTEIEAYALITSPPEPARPAVAVAVAGSGSATVADAHAGLAASAAPPDAPAAETAPEGAERRRSRRIQMRTRVRIRRESGGTAEVLEPANVSRGGIGFHSNRMYALYEKVSVAMHYRTDQPENEISESHGMIVRAVADAGSQHSYGVKFLD